MDLLLEVRNETDIVPHKNNYFFSNPHVADKWMEGNVVLRKWALAYPDLQDCSRITSNKLRKQVATLLQLMNLEKNEASEFAKFMGHTEKTHEEFYEITQDAYQTAKVCRLLNNINDGILPNSVKTVDSAVEKSKEADLEREAAVSESEEERLPFKKLKGRTRWTAEQKEIVPKHFKKHIKQKKVPKKQECQNLISEYPSLNNLDWVKVKTFVYDTYNQNNK